MSNLKDARAQFLLEAPVSSVLWRLAAPNVVAVATMTAVTFADALYVGQLGTEALASLALVFPFLTLMQMMAGGAIGGGTTSAVARAVGAGDIARAESAAWHALLIAIVMSLLFALVFGAYAPAIFMALGGVGATLDGAVAYAAIVFGGAASTWFLFVIAAIHRGTGDTATPARAIVLASILQVALSGALTLGWFGLPCLGIAGPAIAWVACQGMAALYLVAALMRGDREVRLRPQRLRWTPVADIMRVGGLGIINSISISMTVVAVTGFVGRYGVEALAGYGLGARLELMLVPLAFGVGAAMTAAVGVNVGAGNMARARRIAWTGSGIVLAFTGALGLAAAIWPSLWLGLFTSDAEVFAYGARYLAVAGVFYGVFGAGQALYFASQGTGRMGWQVAVTVVRLCAVAGIGAVVLARGWEIDWLFAAVALGLVIMGAGQALCLFARGWREAPAAVQGK